MSILKKWNKKELIDWVNDLDESKRTLYGVILNIIVFSMVEMIIGLFFVNKIINYIIGAILGTVVAIIMVNNMYSVINKALIESEEVAEGIVRKGSIIRTVGVFVFMIFVLSFKEYVNPYMTILCMFNLKFAALIQPFTNKYLIIRYVTKGR